jgi:hypothetical protein
MVATTVIEVGVNVPNASVILKAQNVLDYHNYTSCVDVWVVVQTRVTAF